MLLIHWLAKFLCSGTPDGKLISMNCILWLILNYFTAFCYYGILWFLTLSFVMVYNYFAGIISWSELFIWFLISCNEFLLEVWTHNSNLLCCCDMCRELVSKSFSFMLVLWHNLMSFLFYWIYRLILLSSLFTFTGLGSLLLTSQWTNGWCFGVFIFINIVCDCNNFSNREEFRIQGEVIRSCKGKEGRELL